MNAKAPNTNVIYRRADCVFCGSPDVTKEHLIAAWIPRAIQRRRRPRLNVLRKSLETGRAEWGYGPAQDVALAACGTCNNGFAASLDQAAASALKAPITNGVAVNVPGDELPAVAGWCWKTILMSDLAITAGDNRLAEYAPAFAQAGGRPDPLMEMWLRPSSLIAGKHLMGVLPDNGAVQLGRGSDATTQVIHQWRLMLGRFEIVLRPRLRWIPLPAPPGAGEPLWPEPARTPG